MPIMDLEIISRKDAKRLGLVRCFTGKPCKRGHVAERYVSNNVCIACHREQIFAFRKNNPGYDAAIASAWRRNNPEKYQFHLDSNIEYLRKWRLDNPGRNAELCKKWAQNNAAQKRSSNHQRKGILKQSTPLWADFEKMNQIYAEARSLSEETGVLHAVDHIYPLRGKTVCGLHVHSNLQILASIDNIKKGNKMPFMEV